MILLLAYLCFQLLPSVMHKLLDQCFINCKNFSPDTVQSLYNTLHYNLEFDITYSCCGS